MPASAYPFEVALREGTKVTLRLLTAEDEGRLLAFFQSLPEEDRLYLKDDVTKPEVIKYWIENSNYDRVLPVIALHEDEIVGNATLHQNPFGWLRKTGEVRIVVARKFQHKGLGTRLARELVNHASNRGLDRLVAQFSATQGGAMKAFQYLGFRKEAELKNLVLDLHGEKQDLIVMTHNVAELWQRMRDLVEGSDFGFRDG